MPGKQGAACLQFQEQNKQELERKLSLAHWPLMTCAEQEANHHLLGGACPMGPDSSALSELPPSHLAFRAAVGAASLTASLPGWGSLRSLQPKTLVSSIQLVRPT